MTRHKDSEPTSSSIYTQNDPWEPVVSFEDYIRNNENITNQVRPAAINNATHSQIYTSSFSTLDDITVYNSLLTQVTEL